MATRYYTAACQLCGQPMRVANRGRPRERHPECKDLQNLLDATERALVKVKKTHGFADSLSAGSVRSQLFSISNRIPKARGSDGAFLAEVNQGKRKRR